ncbi:acyl carrier protein [Malaciobacter mytili LMG 24559]|uniref:Acyl carrier protein n=1 Tax=Malaciobacter mytili LMG 24559 TaxID=1032238 RepID=A0AAX2AHV8_9BACT|nr:XRE family transcriptional regulator [Malaciobacter mytili]AXH16369.1 hypothetical protein AMYT_a0069 [Malaciobacter mytili LMG 24559]RXK16433.1 acyl carrier protein [Malaciobacter mytili LMG 24559]
MPLTTEEFDILLNKCKLTKKEFANIFEIEPRTVYNWVNSQKNIPYWVKPFLEHYYNSKKYEAIKNILNETIEIE